MIATIARAKIRFGSYAAMAAVMLLLAAVFPELRIALGAALAVLAAWWVRLDPVGPDGQECEPSRWVAAIRSRLIG